MKEPRCIHRHTRIEHPRCFPLRGKEAENVFGHVLGRIDEFHRKMDGLLKGTTGVEKAFVLGTYLWKLRLREDEK